MIGRQVSHYRIVSYLGGGAMGKVYKAEDTLLKRAVALKFLIPGLTDDADARTRFMQEAQAASSLDHPHIGTVHEIAVTDDGTWFIAMAWYDGGTLKQKLESGPLETHRAESIALQVAQGLSHAHRRGVIHRDIKPANLLFTNRGEVKLVDFGLARLANKAHLTKAGTVMGTAGYMAPEQARGEEVGPEADVWSTGVILFEMLTGRLPFRAGSNLELLHEVLQGRSEPLPEQAGAEHLRSVIARCLDRRPEQRFPNGEELARSLGGSGPISRDSGLTQTLRRMSVRRWAHRRFPFAGLLVLSLVLAAAWGGFLKLPGFGGGLGKRGVAVLPFKLMGQDEAAFEFGQGLSWTLADRLSRLEKSDPDFWVVEPGLVQNAELKDRQNVQSSFGVTRTIDAAGHLEGRRVTMLVTYFDSRHDRQATREFRDDLANLSTWQKDLATWLAGILGLDRKQEGSWDLFSGCTTVPEAFVSCQRGIGRMLVSKEKEDQQAAFAFFAHAVELDSSYAMAWVGLGRTLWRLEKDRGEDSLARVREFLEKGADLDRQSAWPLVYLGQMEEGRGDDAAALDAYRRALSRDPVHPYTLKTMSNLQQRLGHGGEAEATLQRMVAARPGDIRALARLGIFSYGESRFREAEDLFRSLIDIAPGSAPGLSLLGAVLFETGKFDEAETMFRRSLAIKPSFAGYSNLGTLCYYNSSFQDAVEMFRKALDLKDSDYRIWMNLAEAYIWTPGSEDSTRTALQRALELAEAELTGSGGQDMLVSDIASIRANLGQRDRAAKMLEDLATRTHLPAEVMFGMADTYEKIGDRESALTWLERAVSRDLSLKKVKFYPGLRNLRSTERFRKLQATYTE